MATNGSDKTREKSPSDWRSRTVSIKESFNERVIKTQDSMKNIDKSARNIKNLKLIKDEGTNIYDLFKYKNVIITSSSIKKLQNRILNEKN